MLKQQLIRNILAFPRQLIAFSTNAPPINIAKLEAESESALEELNDEVEQQEHEIHQKRNKSRLRPQHARIVHGERPYPEPSYFLHKTLQYQRKQFGRYGRNDGFDPGLCWPTKEELADRMEYERVGFSHDILKVAEEAKEKRKIEKENILREQEEIVKNMAKLNTWKAEMYARINKKEAEALASKQRKDRLIEEVRRHFGFKIDPRDERFKEMLEKKEKEEKKIAKEARKKMREEHALKAIHDAAKAQMEAEKSKAPPKQTET